MNAEKIIYENFIKPFENKKKGNVGTELEFPLINKDGGDIDAVFVSEISSFLETKGFSCVLYGTGGEKLFMENADGDCLSFDNSYNNFEFAMHYSESLCDQSERFNKYLDLVQNYLAKRNHTLSGKGTNPNYGKISVHHVPFSTYDMVQKYLAQFPHRHNIADFPAFLSSVQTHLDISVDELAFAYSVFSKMDFVRGILFHNSPDFIGGKHRIFRDYLWDKSAFGYCPEITGTVDESFINTDDIVQFFLKKGMFNRIRDGKYQVFEPVMIKEYFDCDLSSRKEDIDCYLSFCNVEITRRGTLEVRSDCAQPFECAFTPPAFNTGILEMLGEANARMEKFVCNNNITLSNSKLRSIVAEGESLELIAPPDEIKSLCTDMTEIALTGLKKRGKGEEKLLNINKKTVES